MYKLLLIALLFVWQTSSAQTEYPKAVLAGETETISPENDTLWIMKNSQYKTAITKAKELKVSEEKIVTLGEKIAVLEQKSSTQDSLANVLKYDRDYYQKNFGVCEEDLQTLGKKLKNQKLYTKISIGAAVIILVLYLLK